MERPNWELMWIFGRFWFGGCLTSPILNAYLPKPNGLIEIRMFYKDNLSKYKYPWEFDGYDSHEIPNIESEL